MRALQRPHAGDDTGERRLKEGAGSRERALESQSQHGARSVVCIFRAHGVEMTNQIAGLAGSFASRVVGCGKGEPAGAGGKMAAPRRARPSWRAGGGLVAALAGPTQLTAGLADRSQAEKSARLSGRESQHFWCFLNTVHKNALVVAA